MEHTLRSIVLSLYVTAMLVSSPVLAAPSISNVSGELLNGQNLKISAIIIGVKSPAAPVLWDNFESGSINTGWSEVDSLWQVYSGFGQLLGSKYVLRGDRSLSSSIALRKDVDSHYGDKMYIFLKRRWDFSMKGRNQKILRYWQDGNYQSYAWNYLWPLGGATYQYISRDSYTKHIGDGTLPSTYIGTNFDAIPHGEKMWRTEEFFMQLETSIDACDGVMGHRVNNNLHRSLPENRCMFANTYSSVFRKLYIDNYGECSGGGHDCLLAGSYVWMDDIYIDNTWARVVIGNDPVYDDCSQVEIQPPVVWDDVKDEIVVTLNQGAFETLDGKYLFVIDADNNPSASFLLSSTPITKPSPVQGFQSEQ